MKNKKGAIGLSVETIVVVIISLVILAGGITLMYKWIFASESFKQTIDEQTNAELERLLVEQGKQVALPRNVADLNRKESHVFGIGILNVGPENSFRIEVSPPIDMADGSGNIVPITVNKEDWLLFDGEPFTLKQGESVKKSIEVNAPVENTPLGQYVFTVKVKYGTVPDEKQYGNTQKIVVNVKG